MQYEISDLFSSVNSKPYNTRKENKVLFQFIFICLKFVITFFSD